jgi:hypothetical protein
VTMTGPRSEPPMLMLTMAVMDLFAGVARPEGGADDVGELVHVCEDGGPGGHLVLRD